jgi:hypothetical protein
MPLHESMQHDVMSSGCLRTTGITTWYIKQGQLALTCRKDGSIDGPMDIQDLLS